VEISLQRLWKTPMAITGVILVDGQQRYFSLELPETFEGMTNVPDKCCIPAGTYSVAPYDSPKRGYRVPLVENVPSRTEIEIHIGNFPHDTDGCILIGGSRVNEAMIFGSLAAFEEFMQEFESALQAGESVTLTVS
jgi:hypothetical protein